MDFFKQRLSHKDFKRLSQFIYSHAGIKMPLSKLSMVEARIRKRLIKLNIEDYSNYCDYLFSPKGMESELPFFTNAITTNKTDFFRESGHFEYLIQKAIPELIAREGMGINKQLHLWSAAASRGNEAYTIAIVLSEFSTKFPGLNFNYFILGTDISTEVLEAAKIGIYKHEEIEPVPFELRKKYFLKSKDKEKDLVRVKPEIRKSVKFRHLNLMENFNLRQPMDIIFCRNVLIYFSKDTQDGVILRLCQNLKPGGFLFLGHSEVINCQNFPLVSMAPAVYKKVK
ncbi:MAG: chemotaxis protein CheR [Deltaproteobacteria bacterium]|nr:chemotaxis protein CheR [Deltaproteobacteria bacterium]